MKITDRQIGRAAFTAAVAGTALAPIHALARFATADGKEDLHSGVVRAWAQPAAERLSPLLNWAGPDTVYTTYGKLWAPIFATALLCAVAVRRRRTPAGGEKWGWRLALTGLVGMTVGVTGTYWTPLMSEFFAVTLPFMLAAMIGSTVLGVSLLRTGFRPRATPVLLTLWFPLFVALSSVVAMGAGTLPMLWAWGLAGWSLTGEQQQAERQQAEPATAARARG